MRTFSGKPFPVHLVHRNKVYLVYHPMVVESFLRVSCVPSHPLATTLWLCGVPQSASVPEGPPFVFMGTPEPCLSHPVARAAMDVTWQSWETF